MVNRLPEADARIDGDALASDAGRLASRDSLDEPTVNLAGGVFVGWRELHRRRLASHMHENHGYASLRDQTALARLARQRRHVVDDPRAACDRRLHYGGAARVDRHQCSRSRESTNHWDDP